MNPWEEISLSDYESHMSLDSVYQLQTLNDLMKRQFAAHPVSTVSVFGVAGGNGLEHAAKHRFNKVYGIDINEKYLSAVKERYSYLGDILECRRIDLINEADRLPEAELVIADLVVEYIGYDRFAECVRRSRAKYVSCVIQINADIGTWVSDSPYLHAFDGLDRVHHPMEATALIKAMDGIGCGLTGTDEIPLPNGKKFVMLDFEAM